MARLWTQLAGGRGPGWQAGWTSDRALASRLGQWADVPRLEPKTREKCLALPLSPLNLLRRGTVVRFPPHVTTPGKVTTYCITPTWGNKTASLLFVTEKKPRKLGVQCLSLWRFDHSSSYFLISKCLNCLKCPKLFNIYIVAIFSLIIFMDWIRQWWHGFACGASAQIIILGTNRARSTKTKVTTWLTL